MMSRVTTEDEIGEGMAAPLTLRDEQAPPPSAGTRPRQSSSREDTVLERFTDFLMGRGERKVSERLSRRQLEVDLP